MELQSPSAAKCTEYSNSALSWFLHRKQSQEHEGRGQFGVGRDKLWEGQWLPNMKEWADFSNSAQVMDQNLVQSCDSPLASDSSSSLLTWESSWNSENSYASGRHVLHSPELLSSRFSGFSLLNLGLNHLEGVSKEEASSGKLGHTTSDTSVEYSKPVDFQFHKARQSKGRNDDGWVSDSDNSQSWASTSSQELSKNDPYEKANDMHLGRSSHNHFRVESCESSSLPYSHKESMAIVSSTCGLYARHLASEDVGADALTHPNTTSSQELCCSPPRKPCTLIFAPETYQMHSVQDSRPVAHNSEIGLLNECYAPNGHFKGHDIHGNHEMLEHEENVGKYLKISQCDSARDDRKAKLRPNLCEEWLPPLVKTFVSKSLQSGGKTRPMSHTRSMYSADVKGKFASSTQHGYLRFAEQNGTPCFSFCVDDSDEVLFARVCGRERLSNKENCGSTYTFHSKKDNGKSKGAWMGRPRNRRLASDLVANMKVPDACKSKKNQYGHATEAHFVLCDCGGQQNMESLTIDDEKLQCQQLKPEINKMAASQVGYTCSINNSKKRPCHLGNVKNAAVLENPCAERLNPPINYPVELAAIVIRSSVEEIKVTRGKISKPPLRDGAGWGVKFLDEVLESGWGLGFTRKLSSNATGLEHSPSRTDPDRGGQVERIGAPLACPTNGARPISKDNQATTRLDLTQKLEDRLSIRKNVLKIDVTVILPAGDHGLPSEDEEDDGGSCLLGPTPLLERWASGGECECGGWDMGCGLSVFNAEPLRLHTATTNIGLTRHDCMKWLSPGSPLKVFTNGYEEKKVLVLEIIEAGLFSLSFQARFSPLQAFATAVALFHQQMTHN